MSASIIVGGPVGVIAGVLNAKNKMKPTPEQIKEYSDSLQAAKLQEKINYLDSQLTENKNLPLPCCKCTDHTKENLILECRGDHYKLYNLDFIKTNTITANQYAADKAAAQAEKSSSLPASRSLLHADEKHEQFAEDLSSVLLSLETMLLEKNKAYGDSALSPIGIFARGNPEDLIRVRIDDKLTRIKNIGDGDVEDAEWDLMGYLVLLRIAKRKKEIKTLN